MRGTWARSCAVVLAVAAATSAQADSSRMIIQGNRNVQQVAPPNVYTLDQRQGVVRFGDGVAGARPKPGSGGGWSGGGQGGNQGRVQPCLRVSGRC